MTALENIELCDKGYAEVRQVQTAQKIKLRNSSYAAISNYYAVFAKKTAEVGDMQVSAASIDSVTVSAPATVSEVASDVTITNVVAINPKVAEMINLLEIEGRINSTGHKALKLKPIMYDMIKKNSTSEKEIQKAVELAQVEVASVTEAKPIVEVQEAGIVSEVNQAAESALGNVEDDMQFRANRNGAAVAKVEKYMIPEERNVISPTVVEEVKVIPPTVIEEELARPVSREVPLIAPERFTASTDEKKVKVEPVIHADSIDSVLDNINNLDELREYLATTIKLKNQAEQAKNKESEARASALRAEQEAANSRDQFVQTAKSLAAHQESLIAQTEQSKAQTSIYEAKKGEFEAERDEYQKAINDMLAVMGDDSEPKKER